MNIFLFPIRLLFDRHVVKMILESVQLLYSAWHVNNKGVFPKIVSFDDVIVYRLTHKNHPSAIWTRHCETHYEWLIDYTFELCKEYTYRYKKVHKCQRHVEYLRRIGYPAPEIANDPRQPPERLDQKKIARKEIMKNVYWFPLAMPLKYVSASGNISYENFYLSKAFGTEDEKMKRKATNKREDRGELTIYETLWFRKKKQRFLRQFTSI